MNFTEYCEQNNIKLMEADIKYIRKQLNHIPKDQQKAVMRRYLEIWVNVRDDCENVITGTNRARYAANTWLREGS